MKRKTVVASNVDQGVSPIDRIISGMREVVERPRQAKLNAQLSAMTEIARAWEAVYEKRPACPQEVETWRQGIAVRLNTLAEVIQDQGYGPRVSHLATHASTDDIRLVMALLDWSLKGNKVPSLVSRIEAIPTRWESPFNHEVPPEIFTEHGPCRFCRAPTFEEVFIGEKCPQEIACYDCRSKRERFRQAAARVKDALKAPRKQMMDAAESLCQCMVDLIGLEYVERKIWDRIAELVVGADETSRKMRACIIEAGRRFHPPSKAASHDEIPATKQPGGSKGKSPNEKSFDILLTAALLTHHKFDTTSAHTDPITVGDLARLVGCVKSTVSSFFKTHFTSHLAYKQACSQRGRLNQALEKLAGEQKRDSELKVDPTDTRDTPSQSPFACTPEAHTQFYSSDYVDDEADD